MATIIFIRVCPQEEQEEAEDGTKSENSNKRKSEISGYIDLGYRLKTDDFRAYFEGRKHLIPRPSDLSYYNWATQHAQLQDSPNFRVDANSESGLIFRNKRDRKQINVDPRNDPPEDGTKREELEECGDYTQVVFFDHVMRRKH